MLKQGATNDVDDCWALIMALRWRTISAGESPEITSDVDSRFKDRLIDRLISHKIVSNDL